MVWPLDCVCFKAFEERCLGVSWEDCVCTYWWDCYHYCCCLGLCCIVILRPGFISAKIFVHDLLDRRFIVGRNLMFDLKITVNHCELMLVLRKVPIS